VKSPEARLNETLALRKYNSKWEGDSAPKTRSLFAAACSGLSVDQACALQEHVISLLGDSEAQRLASDSFTPAMQAWVTWMTEGQNGTIRN
jgi:hypothetical protein